MAATTHIRPATIADLTTICEIEQSSFTDAWTPGMFRAHLRGDVNVFLVAVDDADHVLGFVIAYAAAGESEILNLAVTAPERKHGVGGVLLDALMATCISKGATRMTLEVRESNTAARALYTSRGFQRAGRRRSYYESPTEDGLILSANFPVTTGNPAIPQ